MIEIKCNRKILTITEKDIFMHNGSCVQLITQTYFDGYYRLAYRISKKVWKEILNKLEEFEYKESQYTTQKLKYYKLKQEV